MVDSTMDICFGEKAGSLSSLKESSQACSGLSLSAPRWLFGRCGVSVYLYRQLSTGLCWIARILQQMLFLARRVTCRSLLSNWCHVCFFIADLPMSIASLCRLWPKSASLLCRDPVFGLCKLEVWWSGMPFSASLGSCGCVSANLWPACHLHKVCFTSALLGVCLPVSGPPVVFNNMPPHRGISGSVSASVWPACGLHNEMLGACLPVCGKFAVFNDMPPHPGIAGSVSAGVRQVCRLH